MDRKTFLQRLVDKREKALNQTISRAAKAQGKIKDVVKERSQLKRLFIDAAATAKKNPSKPNKALLKSLNERIAKKTTTIKILKASAKAALEEAGILNDRLEADRAAVARATADKIQRSVA